MEVVVIFYRMNPSFIINQACLLFKQYLNTHILAIRANTAGRNMSYRLPSFVYYGQLV